jgi:curli production assembly/transport component CsgE
MNPSVIQIDSIKTKSSTGVIIDSQVSRAVDEIAAIEGTKLKYIIAGNTARAVEVKFDSGILFETGEITLNDQSQEALRKLAGILIKNPATKISIIGHTDNNGTLEFNQKLSENRAKAVSDYLISQKVNKMRFKEIAGKNYSEPVASNSTATGRAINRRVELYIVLSTYEMKPLGEKKDSLKMKPVPTSLAKLVEQTTKQHVKSNDLDIEIDGLLVDDTKTKSGKDFYDLFYSEWEAPQNAKNYTITVSEKPFRLTSTLIAVSINDNVVYQAVLQPRQDIIEAQSEEAISTTQDYLANYEEIMKQINGEDLTGSGIY